MSDEHLGFPAVFPAAPPPWPLPNAQAWWFITSLGLPGGARGDAALGSGHYALEDSRPLDAMKGNFIGGPGMIMILRYTESPVGTLVSYILITVARSTRRCSAFDDRSAAGPYDELMIIPGVFKTPTSIAKGLRITRIYVSSLASVANGRHNWNVPKHLAKFEFIPLSPGSDVITEIRVFAPETISSTAANTIFKNKPFFAASVQTTVVPAIPLDASWLPIPLTLVLPPLNASEKPEHDGLVSTETWKSIVPSFKGRVKPVIVRGLLQSNSAEKSGQTKKLANGVDFPDVQPYSLGIHWPIANISFPSPRIL